jgi:hypothetical protein
MRDLDDDMKELLCRAGEDYPLDTGRRHWEKVRWALQQAQAPGNAASVKSNKKDCWKGWSLIPVPWKNAFRPASADSENNDPQAEATH